MTSEVRVRFIGDDASLARALGRNESRLGSFGKKLAGIGAGAAVGFAGAVTAAGVAAGFMGVKTASANEQASIAFTTMLGSGKKADKFLRDLQAFAAKTPFEFPELQTAASSLISAGINANKVIPIMTTLGDVTAGMGTGSEGVKRATVALQQMNAAGRITGEDLNQLRDAGIPVYDLLAAATGKSKGEVVKLAQAGKLGQHELGQMMKALENGKGLERFSGLMDKQSASLSGMWSTFKDTLGQGLAQVITPLIPLMKDGLGKASEGLARVLPMVGQGLAAVGSWVTGTVIPAMSRLHDWVAGRLWPALQKGAQVIMPGLKSAMGILSGGVEGNGMSWKKVGDIITSKVIPVLSVMIAVWLPNVARNIRIIIEVVKAVWRVFEVWMGVVRTVIAFILRRFSDLAGMWAGVLRALSKVPGFGWAADAARKLDNASGRANALASSIERIPNSKNVSINVSAHVMTGRIKVGGEWVNVGMRAKGGPVRKGFPYIVGENEPELFIPDTNGQIVNQRQMRNAGPSLAGRSGGLTVNVYLTGAIVDPVNAGRQIVEVVRTYARSTGQPLVFGGAS